MQAQHCEESPDHQGTRCGHLEHACKLIADGQTDIRQASTDLQKQVKVGARALAPRRRRHTDKSPATGCVS